MKKDSILSVLRRGFRNRRKLRYPITKEFLEGMNRRWFSQCKKNDA